MKKDLICFIFLTLLFCSCSSEQNNGVRIIPVTVDIEKLPQITSAYRLSYEIIPLGDISLVVSDINKLIISDTTIVTLNEMRQDVNIFKRSGKHIAKIPIGRGPGEIMMPSNIYVDPHKRTLEILSYMTNTISIYDLNGSFIDKIQITGSIMNMDFGKVGERYLLHNCGFGGENYQNVFTIIEYRDGEISSNYYLPRVHYDNSMPMINTGPYITNADTLIFTTPYRNYIYGMTANDSLPFPVYKVDNTYGGAEGEFSSNQQFRDYCESNNLFEHIISVNIMNDGNLWLLNLNGFNKYKTIFWDRSSDNTYSPVLSFDKDWLLLGTPYFSDQTYSYHLFNPFSITKVNRDNIPSETYQLYDMLLNHYHKVGDDSNPCVIAVKYEKL